MQPRLVAIGLTAGFFGALFGVGGGIVMVPMLIGVAAFAAKPAMATSLAAIGLIALEGVVFYRIKGDLRPLDAAVLGIPAAVGAAFGTAVQQRLANRTLSLAFAALLAGVAVRLFV
ncbi:MAG TPA: sulfite exporter TauE/SafE family protein [Gaiellaceae bacterium]|nr:sulfite exporter TauE/SafE family protein [Gaiellaceae bacterium]